LFFICCTSPFSKGGGSGCVFAGEEATLGLEAVIVAAAAAAEGGEGLAGICFGWGVDDGDGEGGCLAVASFVEVESFGWLLAAILFSSPLLLALMLLPYL
jgi:hypothetical protein